MIKLTDILSEINITLIRPSLTKEVITKYVSKLMFVIDDIEYVLGIWIPEADIPNQIKLTDQTYEIDIISLDFSVKKGYSKQNKLTNVNTPFFILSNIVGCIDIWANSYKKKFLNTNQNMLLNSVYYNPTQEWTGDNRRDNIFLHYIKKYASTKNSSVTIKHATGGTQCLFHPALKW